MYDITSVLNKLNVLAIDGEDVDEYKDSIIEEAKNSNPDLADNEAFNDILDDLDDYLDESDGWDILESEFPFTIKRVKYNLKGQIDLIRKRKPYGITLVDFKTTDEDSLYVDDSRYNDQLHFYYLAMKNNSKYKNYNDIDLKLFSLKDFEEVPVSFNQEQVNELEGKLNRVHSKIMEKQYYPTDDVKSKCNGCLLRYLSGKD